MAVTRYRSVEEMPPPWRDPDDPRNLATVAIMMTMQLRLAGDGMRPRGVRRFRSHEEAALAEGSPWPDR